MAFFLTFFRNLCRDSDVAEATYCPFEMLPTSKPLKFYSFYVLKSFFSVHVAEYG